MIMKHSYTSVLHVCEVNVEPIEIPKEENNLCFVYNVCHIKGFQKINHIQPSFLVPQTMPTRRYLQLPVIGFNPQSTSNSWFIILFRVFFSFLTKE